MKMMRSNAKIAIKSRRLKRSLGEGWVLSCHALGPLQLFGHCQGPCDLSKALSTCLHGTDSVALRTQTTHSRHTFVVEDCVAAAAADVVEKVQGIHGLRHALLRALVLIITF